MRTYCMGSGGFLKSPPSARMGEIIEHLQTVVRDGGREHIRMARGHGKSSFVKCAVVYALAYGFRRFVVTVSARSSDASAMIADIFALFEDGEAFGEDFPEIAVPIRKLGGIMQRAQNQTYNRKRTKIGKTAERIVLPTITGSASSGSLIVARGFKGAARGLVRGSLRPDLVVFDDLQDDKVARNPRIVAEYDRRIENNFLGLGGHDKQISALMTSTPICPDDLSETYAAKSNWKTFTFRMLISEPACWGMPGDKWKVYFQIRRDAITNGEAEHIRANEFYASNRAEMDAGAEVLNPDFYDHENELSGIQHAMNLRFANGEDSFSAEYQMRPIRAHDVFSISAPLVLSRVRKGVLPFTKPPETVFTALATDLNPAKAYSWAIVCFDKWQTGLVAAYGTFTGPPLPIRESIPERERTQLCYNALTRHGCELVKWLKAHSFDVDMWGIDAGGKQIEPVMEFGRHSGELCGLKSIPMLGRAGRSWNPNVKSRIAEPRNGVVLCADRSKGWKWVAFNADAARETSQKAWFGEIGAPGGLSLYDGNARHGEFAAQVSAEQLEYKVTLQNGRTDYRWRLTHADNHFGDCITECYALAALFGISSGGYIAPKRKASKSKITFKRGRYCK